MTSRPVPTATSGSRIISGDAIGRITPLGTATEFRTSISPGARPQQIIAGSDGNVWFTEAYGRIGRITPAGVITEISAGISGTTLAITAGPDENLWFTEPDLSKVTRMSTGAPLATVVAVEYYYEAWNYYFETASADDIAILDGGAFGGVWKRTGETFNVWPRPNTNSSPTCRFFQQRVRAEEHARLHALHCGMHDPQVGSEMAI